MTGRTTRTAITAKIYFFNTGTWTYRSNGNIQSGVTLTAAPAKLDESADLDEPTELTAPALYPKAHELLKRLAA